MMSGYANYVFESELKRIKEILPDILIYVNSNFPFISEADLFDLRVVYKELLVNAVIHGNKGDLSKKVELTIIPKGNEIVSIVKDEGKGFDYLRILNSYFYDPLCEHGKGLRLVRSLTENLSFNNAGNEVEFCKKIMYNRKIDHYKQIAILSEASAI